jgi:excisionase family DNA binding protein
MENKTTNISGQIPEQERKFAELQERVDKLESICFASKEVLNLEEAAAFLGVKKSTLYKMTHFSQIPYYKPAGKLIFFEKSALLDWVRNVKVKSEDEIREEAALHLSSLSIPRSERTHV